MAIKQTTAFQVATTRGVKTTVYGRGGVGKTMLGLTMPPPIAYGTIESGMLSVSKANQLRVFGHAVDCDVFELGSVEDLVTFHDWMSDVSCPFASIVLDSITDVSEKALAHGLSQVKDPRMAYGALFSQIVDVFWRFREIEKNVLFIAQEAPNKDGCVPLHIPMMPGNKLGAKVPYMFDELFHMNVGKLEDGTTYRFLQTQPSVEFDAKDRSGALEEIEEPNLSKIIAKIVS